jgi:hypothetical protein
MHPPPGGGLFDFRLAHPEGDQSASQPSGPFTEKSDAVNRSTRFNIAAYYASSSSSIMLGSIGMLFAFKYSSDQNLL